MASNILARRTLSNHLVEMRAHDRNTRDRQTMQRTIIKQGYLKKLPNASRLGSSLKKVERRWFIFGVMGHTDPYLEYYENEDSIFGSRPLNIIFLDTCYKITRDQKTSRFINIFTLVLKERQLSLVAPTRDTMFEWSRAIEDKLCNLGFIESSSHGANDYIRIPAMERRYPEAEQNVPPPERHYLEVRSSGSSFTNVPERDYLEVRASGINFPTEPFALDANGQDENDVEREVRYGNVPTAQHMTEMTCEDTYDLTFSPKVTDDVSIYMTASPESEDLYMNVAKSSAADSETTDSTTSSSAALSAAAYDDQLNPESVYLQCTASPEPSFSPPPALPPMTLVRPRADTPSSIGHSARPIAERPAVLSPISSPSAVSLFPESSEIKVENNRRSVPSFHLPSYDEAMTPAAADEVLSRYGDSRFANHPLPGSRNASTRCLPSSADLDSSGGELSANCASGIADFPSPPPYSSQKVLFKGANLPLKQIQVQKLIEEMGSPQGIQVVVPKSQCQHSIAFTDCFSKIWISGWNQRTCPTFHSFLHIGDQLIAINGVAPNSRLVAKKMLKTCSGKTDATLTIRRIPCGRVVAIRKDNAVESLGVTVVNGTAEVGFIDPTGLARQSGLEEKAPAMTGIAGSGSWWITEINHQPLNLFYKDDEAKHRLNAMGNHISFVVQPTHLIVEMKKQIKNLKGFRDFLVQ